jgi:hypothetical protein
MDINIDTSSVQPYLDMAQEFFEDVEDYFMRSPQDEDIAWIAIGTGLLLCILGLLFL